MFNTLKESYAKTGNPFIFDMSNHNYFDSTLVSLFVQSIRITGERKNSLIISDQKTCSILTLLGIDKLLDIYETETEWMQEKNVTTIAQ